MPNDENRAMSRQEKLIHMANQIAAFFETMPHDDAAREVARHINDFWEPRMRRQLFDILHENAGGLKPLVLDAAPMIRRPVEAGRP